MMRRLLVAQPALVGCLARLVLVGIPFHVLGRDLHPWRGRGGRRSMCGFAGHEAIVSHFRRTLGLGSGDVLDDDLAGRVVEGADQRREGYAAVFSSSSAVRGWDSMPADV
jgi:hypothetical protein